MIAYIPRRSSVKALGNIVVALAMSAHEYNLILHVPSTLPVVAEDLVIKPLPLSLLSFTIVLVIGIISAIDQTCDISSTPARERLDTPF